MCVIASKFGLYKNNISKFITNSLSNAASKDNTEADAQKIYSDEELAKVVDDVMPKMDIDEDGFVSFAEYVSAYNKEMKQQTVDP